MLPVLTLAQDGSEHRVSDAIQQLGKELRLSEDQLTELLPSGRQTIFSNRVHWAKTYLSQAGLLQITRRSHFCITDRGRKVLQERLKKIDVNYLKRFDEFRDFQIRERLNREIKESREEKQSEPDASETPDEVIRSTIGDIETVLAKELLGRILGAPPSFFENLIVTLLLSMGYGGSREDAGRAIGKSGDNGIDGVIDQDPLGLERVYVQAKRYDSDLGVGESAIREFAGSLGAAKANKGVFVTTSYFTKSAKDFAERHPHKIVLIDGSQLTSLMLRHNVGVRILETLYLRSIDEEFFLND